MPEWLTPETAFGAAVPLLGGCIWLAAELKAERKRSFQQSEVLHSTLRELRDILVVLKERTGG